MRKGSPGRQLLGGWLALEIAVRSTAKIETLTVRCRHSSMACRKVISPLGRKRAGLHTFYDPKLAEARLPKSRRKKTLTFPEEPFFDAKMACILGSITRNFRNGCTGSTFRRLSVGRLTKFSRPPTGGHAKVYPRFESAIVPECGHLPQQEKLDDLLP